MGCSQPGSSQAQTNEFPPEPASQWTRPDLQVRLKPYFSVSATEKQAQETSQPTSLLGMLLSGQPTSLLGMVLSGQPTSLLDSLLSGPPLRSRSRRPASQTGRSQPAASSHAASSRRWIVPFDTYFTYFAKWTY